MIERKMRELIEEHDDISFIIDAAPDVVIVPVILDADSTEDESKIGKLQFQVSDDVAGERTSSIDVYTWEDAKEAAINLQNRFEGIIFRA